MSSNLVIVIAKQHDLHADAVVDKLHDKSDVLRIDPQIEIPSISFLPGTQCVVGSKKFTPESVSGILCRYALDSLSAGDISDPVKLFAFAEHFAGLLGILHFVPQKYWINYPWIEARADGKLFPLVLARSYGLKVPEFIVSSDTAVLRQFHKGVATIIKPLSDAAIAEQEGEYVEVPSFAPFKAPYTCLYDGADLDRDQFDDTPTLLQHKVDKRLDVRVVVIDETVFATSVISSETDPVDVRIVQKRSENVYTLDKKLTTNICRFVKEGLSLRFATMDFLVDKKGEAFLIDINPQGNWLWQELDCGLPISNVLANKLSTPIHSA